MHSADIIFTNAQVFTSDDSNPRAEAVAIKANRIIHVGSNEDIEEWRGKGTRVIDALGRTLTPGFIDSHFHLLWGAIRLGTAQLQEVKNLNDLKAVLLAFAETNKTSSWV